MTKEILKLEGDPFIKGTKGSTVLHICAERSFPGICKEILMKHPKLALEADEEGNTPLHVACEWNSIEVVELIFEMGGGNEVALLKNSDGMDSLEYAYSEN
jgi:ankyrin repeat protein